MNRTRKTILNSLLSLLVSFTVVEVIVPINLINSINLMYISLSVYLLVFLISSILFNCFWNLVRINIKKYALLFIVILVLWLLVIPVSYFNNLQKTSIEITALGEKNSKSNSSEVWLSRLVIDGNNINLSTLNHSTNGWSVKYDILGSFGNQPSNLSFDIYSRQNYELELQKHSFSGKAIIQIDESKKEIDLYSPENELETFDSKGSRNLGVSIYHCLITYSFIFVIISGASSFMTTNARYQKKIYKRWAIGTASIFILVTLSLSLLVYAVDPLQYFHKSSKSVHYTQERFQNPGFIKNYDYDTIIVGSSMTQNFLPSEVNQVFNGKTIKLSIAGSSSKELYYLTNLALSQENKVKNVLYGIDLDSILNASDFTQSVDQFPVYLYDKNPFNDLQYLLNKKFISDSWGILRGNENPEYLPLDLELVYSWGQYVTYGTEKVLENYKQSYLNNKHLYSEVMMKNAADNLQFNIIELVRNNPNVKFVFFYSPYSIVYFSHWYNTDPAYLQLLTEVKEEYFNELKKYNNVELYDFSSLSDLTLNLSNYKDVVHYSDSINSFILQSIKNKDYIVTDQNLQKNIDIFNQKVKSFDLTTFINN